MADIDDPQSKARLALCNRSLECGPRVIVTSLDSTYLKGTASFWSREATKHFVESCLEQGLFADAALRLSCEEGACAREMAGQLLSQNRVAEFCELLKGFSELGGLDPSGLIAELASHLKGLPEQLQRAFGEGGGLALARIKELQPSLKLLESAANLASSSAEILELVERCDQVWREQRLRAAQANGGSDLEELQKLLMSLSLDASLGPGHEKGWKRLAEKPDAARPAQQLALKYTENLPEDRTRELAESFLFKGEVPRSAPQRRNIFRLLFFRAFIDPGLAQRLEEAFLAQGAQAESDKAAVNLDWLGAKGEAGEKLQTLQRLQCLLPPDPVVDFCAAFLEMRQGAKGGEDSPMQRVIQSELQIPTPWAIVCGAPGVSRRLLKLVEGFRDYLDQQRVDLYLKDGRISTAAPYLVAATARGSPWTRAHLDKHLDALLGDLAARDGARGWILLAGAARRGLLSASGEAARQRLSAEIAKSAKTVLDEGRQILPLGPAYLYRALALGSDFEALRPLLEACRDKLRQQAQSHLQQLAFKVGDVLGEAMSKSSVITIPTKGDAKGQEIGDKLSRLYDLFRDVLLQQDPYEKNTQATLKGILEDAQALIREADSIHQSKSASTYDRISQNPRDSVRALLFGEEDSIVQVVTVRYLQDEEYIDRTTKSGEARRLVPEHLLIRNFARILVELVTREITVENNPLLLQLGEPLENFLNFGQVDLDWWQDKGDLTLKAHTLFSDAAQKRDPIVINDRFIISHMVDWIRFENEEALKLPFRKGMSVVCTHLTHALVACRRTADELFKELLAKIDTQKYGELPSLLVPLRKATYQINSMEILKSSGFLPPNYDRSIEPRVRNFVESLARQVATYHQGITDLLRQVLPKVYILDKHEFKIGMVLRHKERSLKRFLHANLDELVRNYLRENQKNSIPNKIEDVCIRVQQGIAVKRSEMRNVRYSPILLSPASNAHSPSELLKLITSFEDNFPIIDRITGSRQTVDSNVLVFNAENQGTSNRGIQEYLERVDRYLDNAQKLARQLRIIIIPGEGTGCYECYSNSLCLPLVPGEERSREQALLSALADYLFHIKFVNEESSCEEEVLEVLNRKAKTLIKAGSSDSRIKITELLYREICALCGVKGPLPNLPNISSLLVKHILGAENTMIYRELRNLSAAQKVERFDGLREKYNCLRRSIPVEEGVLDVILPLQKGGVDPLKSGQRPSIYRAFQNLTEIDQYAVKDELYDLAVLLYHYNKVDPSYQIFDLLTRLDPKFAESYWGLGMAARSLELTVVNSNQREATALRSFRAFSEFTSIGGFWRKRALDIIKKLTA